MVNEVEDAIVYNINENNYIKTQISEVRGRNFYDVTFVSNGKEAFLGRFFQDENMLHIAYNDGKILIYYSEYDNIEKKTFISEVLVLYEIIDDTIYSCTQEEALEIFDKTFDTSHLTNKTEKICRSDVEKKKRLRLFDQLLKKNEN